MKLNISKRVEQVVESPIRKFLPSVREAESRGIKIFKLNVGDPDILPPDSFYREMQQHLSGNLNYAPSPGIQPHVEAWLKYYAGLGVKLTAENIIPTVGAAEAIFMAFLSVTEAGDEVIMFEPFYTNYKGLAVEAGINIKPLRLDMRNDFKLPSNRQIEKFISKETKAMVVINPNNPTGSVLSKAERVRTLKLIKKHGLFLIADETYRDILFDGQPTSFLADKSYAENVIVIDSASKRFSMPGARIGLVASRNNEVMRAILRLAMVRLSAPTLEQLALVPVLRNSISYVRVMAKEYKARRDVVVKYLKKIQGIKYSVPNGAFYIIVRLPVKDSEDFVQFMLSEFNYKNMTVHVTPAADFYASKGCGRDEIRIAFVLNCQELEMAMEVFEKGWNQYKKRVTING